jgi:hypothetical protein
VARLCVRLGLAIAVGAQLTARIGELCRPYERQVAQLSAIPGVSERTAQDPPRPGQDETTAPASIAS